MAGKQLEFPELQTHKKSFEFGVLGFCVLCIVFVIICVAAVSGGVWT